MNLQDKSQELREILSVLIGQELVGSENWCATRNFDFRRTQAADTSTIMVECAWRIRRADKIFVGSEDYSEKAEDNTEESWEPGTPTGHFQNQRFGELLGELKGTWIVSTKGNLIVQFVEADECYGFVIGLGDKLVLEVFPASTVQMEWMFRLPGGGAVVLMNGILNRT